MNTNGRKKVRDNSYKAIYQQNVPIRQDEYLSLNSLIHSQRNKRLQMSQELLSPRNLQGLIQHVLLIILIL